jgi:hypothetical protein
MMFRFSPPDPLGASDCEAIRDGWLAQPTNAVSSLAYVAAGAWLGRRLVTRSGGVTPLGAGYVVLLVGNGVGSFAYHGPQLAGAEVAHDIPAVGLVVLTVGTVGSRLMRRRPVLPGATATGVAVTGVAAVVGAFAYQVGRTAGRLCEPSSYWQAHGLWHVSTAVAFAALADMVVRPATTDDPPPPDPEATPDE